MSTLERHIAVFGFACMSIGIAVGTVFEFVFGKIR